MSKNRNYIPELINKFNVYKDGGMLIGISGEMKLPDFSSITDTLDGPGILGKVEVAVIGAFDEMEQEITFRTLDTDIFTLIDPTINQGFTLRGSEQVSNSETGELDTIGMRIVYRGKVKNFQPGTMKQGEQMGASVTLGLTYVMIEVDGKKKIELDKMNSVYKVNGKDIMEKIRRFC